MRISQENRVTWNPNDDGGLKGCSGVLTICDRCIIRYGDKAWLFNEGEMIEVGTTSGEIRGLGPKMSDFAITSEINCDFPDNVLDVFKALSSQVRTAQS